VTEIPAAHPFDRPFYEEEHEEFREVAREFTTRDVAPHYAAWDAQHMMPRSMWTAAGEAGLLGLAVPEEFGGMGLTDYRFRAVLDEELVRQGALGVALALHLHDDWVLPHLLAHGTDEQKQRWLPRMLTGELVTSVAWTEPGAGSDLRGVRTRAVRDGEEWVLTGQKVWTTWAHVSDWGVCLARTDTDVPKRRGITYFLVDLHAPGVEVRPLRHITGEVDFNEVFLDGVRVADGQRVGAEGDGWKVAGATLSGERQMVSGAGSGGVDRIGGSGTDALLALARSTGGWDDPVARQQVVRLWSEERIRGWTNARVRATLKAGRSPGPESSVGKVHQGDLNQRIQLAACDLLGAGATAWQGDRLPAEVKGMLRSRANTIEGGTTEVNKNVVGERVLGLPREPDPYKDAPWKDVPRS
jgi:alkylation response protein AidB-like acyl-CoA dehydrogenase